jgi:hypothetical protein
VLPLPLDLFGSVFGKGGGGEGRGGAA